MLILIRSKLTFTLPQHGGVNVDSKMISKNIQISLMSIVTMKYVVTFIAVG